MSTFSAARKGRRFQPLTFLALLGIHLAAGLAFFPWFFSWPGLILAVLLIWLTASHGASATYHRMLSHRAWQPVPWLRTVLLFWAALCLEMGPINWAATHRLHHRESDHEDDPHSPLVSFLWSHMLWLFFDQPRLVDKAELRKLVPDLIDDRELRFFQRWFGLMWVGFAALTYLAGYLAVGGGMPGVQLGLSLVVWGSLLRTVLVWHNTWFVNSVTHLFGYRNFNTEDESRNLWWVSVVTFGEGWHNNHHAIAGTANYGMKWWEFDPTWWSIRTFQLLGWVQRANLAPHLRPQELVRDFPGKYSAKSPRLLRRPERLALSLLRRLGNSPAALVKALHSRRSNVREAAALALGNLGASAQEAAEALRQALTDRSLRVQEAALKALRSIEAAIDSAPSSSTG
ncbi:fatty acid desaturase [bacterium]|nr:fatty acid desaturase [bacterium]